MSVINIDVHKEKLSYTKTLSIDDLQVPSFPAPPVPTLTDDSDTDQSETGSKTPHLSGQKLIGRRRVSDTRKRASFKSDVPPVSFKICIYETIIGNRAQEWPGPGKEGEVTISVVDRVQCVVTTQIGKKMSFRR